MVLYSEKIQQDGIEKKKALAIAGNPVYNYSERQNKFDFHYN